jgi:O-antigen/teichoic acid export membrane protein
VVEVIRGLLKDLARYVPSKIVPALVGFVSIPLLTKLFPPDAYGDYRLALAAVVLVGTAAGWLPSSILRFFPAQDSKGNLGFFYANLFRFWAFSTLVLSAIWVLVLVMGRESINDRLYQYLWISLALLISQSIFGALAALVRSRREINSYSFASMWRAVMVLAVGAFFVLVVGTGPEGFLWGMILAGLSTIPILWPKASRDVSVDFSSGVDRHLASGMARYAFPLMLGSFAGWLLKLSDRFLIEAFATSTDLGIYSAAYGLAEQSIGVIIQLFHLPFVVMGNQIWERDGSEAAAKFVSQVTRFFMVVAIPAVVGISVLSKPLMTVMTGPEYVVGYRIMPWVASGMLLYGFSQWFLAAFMFTKRMAFNTVGIVVGGVANVALNLILIPRYGYEAAAITSLIGFGVVLVVIIPKSRQLFLWRFPLRSLARIGLASGVMGLLLVLLQSLTEFSAVYDLVLGLPLGIVVAGAMLVVLGEFSPRELAAVRKMRYRDGQ